MIVARVFLISGIAMPFIYLGILFGFGFVYPDFSHTTQMPSELGADDAPYTYATAFNIGLMLVGLTACEGAMGLFLAFKEKGLNMALTLLTAITLFLFGISYILFGIFPLPDPRHGEASILLFPGVFTPLLGAFAVRSIKRHGNAWKAIFVAAVINITLFVVIMFSDVVTLFSEIVDEAYVGIWIRAMACIIFFTLGYLCWTVWRLCGTDTASQPD